MIGPRESYRTSIPRKPTNRRPVMQGRVIRPLIATIEEDRRHDEQTLWEVTDPMARHLLANMRSRRDGR